MSVEVLFSRSEIRDAQHSLRALRARVPRMTAAAYYLRRAMNRLGIPVRAWRADRLKSWDVAKTLAWIENHVPKDGRLLDIGAVNSEIPWLLKGMGYRVVVACDISWRLFRMPRQLAVRYSLQDAHRLALRDCSVNAITAISVIEHGFQLRTFLEEAFRTLQPGGYLIMSTDYYPLSIATNTELYGVGWNIFSKASLLELVSLSEEIGFESTGPVADLDRASPVIRWMGKEYTFAWVCLRRSAG